MVNYSCSLNSVLAWIAWALALIAAALNIFISHQFDVLVILCAAAGATIHARGFVHGLECRERSAFELGRESVRAVR